jgi:hypothetical protein
METVMDHNVSNQPMRFAPDIDAALAKIVAAAESIERSMQQLVDATPKPVTINVTPSGEMSEQYLREHALSAASWRTR